MLVSGISQAPTPVVAAYYGVLGGWHGSSTFTVRISAPLGLDLRAGAASSIVADKPIWTVGLGKMRNGVSAGEVGFRQADFSASNFFTPNALYYSASDPNEVVAIAYYNGTYYANNAPAGATLLQVFSREVLLNISQITPNVSYKIDAYPASQVGARQWVSNGLGGYYTTYALSGSPVATYTISQISGGVDITWQQDGVTWDTSLTKSGSVWTFSDWHVQGTASTATLLRHTAARRAPQRPRPAPMPPARDKRRPFPGQRPLPATTASWN